MYNKEQRKRTKQGFVIFLRIFSGYRKAFIFFTFFGVLVSFINGAIPYISGKLFDSIVAFDQKVDVFGTDMPFWAVMLTVWMTAQVALRVLDWVTSTQRTLFARNLETDYMSQAIHKLTRLPLSFFKQNKIGDTARRINNASDRLETVMNMVFDLGPEFLSLVFGFIFIFIINYTFGFIVVGTVALYSVVIWKVLVPTSQMRHKIHSYYDTSYSNFYDALGSVKTVKQSGQEYYEERRFESGTKKMHTLFVRLTGIQEGVSFVQKVLVVAMQFTIFLISVYAIHAGTITIGDLFAVNGYAAMVLGPFSQITRWWNWFSDCLVSLTRAEKIFGHREEIYRPKGSEGIKSLEGDIAFRNVTFSYIGGEDEDNKKERTDVLKNVSFKIQKGETVALVGRSGVGKTTIADLISGFYFPQKGSVVVDGHDTREIPLHLLRRSIAVVSQDITIFNESIKYNIRYGREDIKESGVVAAAKEAGAHEFIREFKKKYNQLVGERGVKLSGGQRQRVAIAQAILKNAEILILDEPTSALDAQTENLVTKSLEKLMKGKTTIIIAHRLATVRKADKIIVLEKGRVVEEGKHKDLIKKKNGAYRKFYELQKL